MHLASKQTLIAVTPLLLFASACAKKPLAKIPQPPPSPNAVEAPAPQRQAPPPSSAPVAQAPANSTPAARYPDAPTRKRIDELLARIEDAYFDYDKSTLRPDALQALQGDSAELRDILKDYPEYKLTIEGHADERGSAEYNVALGDRRAAAAKGYLVQVGIPATQLDVVSYGKERPACQDHDENCWQKNRRIHIVAASLR